MEREERYWSGVELSVNTRKDPFIAMAPWVDNATAKLDSCG